MAKVAFYTMDFNGCFTLKAFFKKYGADAVAHVVKGKTCFYSTKEN